MEASFNGVPWVQYLDRKKFATTPTMEVTRQIPIQLNDFKRTFVYCQLIYHYCIEL